MKLGPDIVPYDPQHEAKLRTFVEKYRMDWENPHYSIHVLCWLLLSIPLYWVPASLYLYVADLRPLDGIKQIVGISYVTFAALGVLLVLIFLPWYLERRFLRMKKRLERYRQLRGLS